MTAAEKFMALFGGGGDSLVSEPIQIPIQS
jgi:hypothetical protein